MLDKETTRRCFDFSVGAEQKLQVIMDRCGTNNSAEIIRKALRLYEWAVEEVDAGKRICAVDAAGKGEWIDIHG